MKSSLWQRKAPWHRHNFRTVSVDGQTAFATIYFDQPTGQLDEVAASELWRS